MKHEELLKLTKDQLNARLKEIGASAKTAEGEVLDALLTASGLRGQCGRTAAGSGRKGGKGGRDSQGIRQARKGVKRRRGRPVFRPYSDAERQSVPVCNTDCPGRTYRAGLKPDREPGFRPDRYGQGSSASGRRNIRTRVREGLRRGRSRSDGRKRGI